MLALLQDPEIAIDLISQEVFSIFKDEYFSLSENSLNINYLSSAFLKKFISMYSDLYDIIVKTIYKSDNFNTIKNLTNVIGPITSDDIVKMLS